MTVDSSATEIGHRGIVPWLALGARLVVGIAFIMLGSNKLADPVAFLKAIREYHLVPEQHFVVVNTIAGLLPWAEILLGAFLVLGIARRGSALVLLVMLVAFTLAIYQRSIAIAADQAIPFTQVRFDCGCGNGVVQASKKLLENSLLIALSVFLVVSRGSRCACRDVLF